MKLKDWEWISLLWKPISWVFSIIVALITLLILDILYKFPCHCLISLLGQQLRWLICVIGRPGYPLLIKQFFFFCVWILSLKQVLINDDRPFTNNVWYILDICWSWRGLTSYSSKAMQGLGRLWYPSYANGLIKVLFALLLFV